MEKFNIQNNGYSTREVDDFLNKMKIEYQQKINKQNDEMLKMKQEMNDLSYSLELYKKKEKQVSSALVQAIKKADDISNSAIAVYNLEIKRVQLLYRKWEGVLEELRNKFAGLLPNNELDDLVGDFQYALTLTLNSQRNAEGERIYSKSILERMQHRAPSVNNEGKIDPAITLKETEIKVEYDSEGNRINQIIKGKLNNAEYELTPADKFLMGEKIDLPESMGNIGPDMLAIPPKEFRQALEESESGFNLKEALNPTQSLKDIMKAFDLEIEDKL